MTAQSPARSAAPLFLLLCCALFWGCAKPPPAPPEGYSLTPSEVWQRFEQNAHQAEANAGPFRISASLSYQTRAGSQRVSVYFWGNGDSLRPHPLRLDILAGPGNVAAKVREDTDVFLAYAPGEKTAYTHSGGNLNLLAFGVPLPFSLADLSLLLTGQYTLFFLDAGAPGRSFPMPPVADVSQTSLRYRLYDARLPGELELNAEGLPVSWTENGDTGWRMELTYWDESTRTTPKKLRLTHPKGAEATVLVRELARPDAFTPLQLALPLPPGTAHKPLREQREPQ